MAIRTVEFTEGKRTWKTADLDRQPDREDALTGLAFAEPPAGWSARTEHGGGARRVAGRISGPGVHVDVTIVSGFGDLPCDVLRGKMMMHGSKPSKFAGQDALREDIAFQGHATANFAVPYKRRLLQLRVRSDDASKLDAAVATAAKLLAPTFD
jgi:hypothetical protein